eukprot:CAMPEP_0206055636 /NCGR_PEP_ID=MMETSP1466-20131121/40482_1 /ASSEMBLY_ACC=CAM_ASM_001126 /TAXON_ID=44452 /ORGANISM="Pavlova gyrans, Strain CCMP608" /LENGTH=194 /DNA_ID=CAMNT_0053430863 /DNA_START=69 /DNA_END=653 /DNA_ORIENTATION=-
MPFFIRAFAVAEVRESISAALKQLQTPTRTLQSHCAQSKASHAVGSLAQQPHVKKQLELYIFNVKHMLEENKCGAAFWMGNLKHKTASGVPVSSQVERPRAKRKSPARQPLAKRQRKAMQPLGEDDEVDQDEMVDVDSDEELKHADDCDKDDSDGGSDDEDDSGDGSEDGEGDEEDDDDDDDDEDASGGGDADD